MRGVGRGRNPFISLLRRANDPRRGFPVAAAKDDARMEYREHQGRDDYHWSFEDVEGDFFVGELAVEAFAEFDNAIDASDHDDGGSDREGYTREIYVSFDGDRTKARSKKTYQSGTLQRSF